MDKHVPRQEQVAIAGAARSILCQPRGLSKAWLEQAVLLSFLMRPAALCLPLHLTILSPERYSVLHTWPEKRQTACLSAPWLQIPCLR